MNSGLRSFLLGGLTGLAAVGALCALLIYKANHL